MISFRIGNTLLALAGFLSITVYIAKLLMLDQIVSICFALSIACVLLFYIFKVLKKRSIKLSDIFLFSITGFTVFAPGLSLSFDYYKPAIIAICTAICIDVSPENYITKSTKQAILIFMVFAAVLTNWMYYFGGLSTKYYGSTFSVTLNFANPNETGMWLAFFSIILANGVIEQDTTFKKLILIASCASLFPILLRTQSRASLIAVLFYLCFRVLSFFVHIRKLPTWIVALIAFAPAIVYSFYMYLFIPNLDFFSEYLSFLVSEGKSLTSRVAIWEVFQSDFAQCALFGQYDIYRNAQMHNSFCTLSGMFGVPWVIIIFLKFVFAQKKFTSALPQVSLCSVWLIGCFETSFWGGVGGLYLMLMLLPVIGCPSQENM